MAGMCSRLQAEVDTYKKLFVSLRGIAKEGRNAAYDTNYVDAKITDEAMRLYAEGPDDEATEIFFRTFAKEIDGPITMSIRARDIRLFALLYHTRVINGKNVEDVLEELKRAGWKRAIDLLMV